MQTGPADCFLHDDLIHFFFYDSVLHLSKFYDTLIVFVFLVIIIKCILLYCYKVTTSKTVAAQVESDIICNVKQMSFKPRFKNCHVKDFLAFYRVSSIHQVLNDINHVQLAHLESWASRAVPENGRFHLQSYNMRTLNRITAISYIILCSRGNRYCLQSSSLASDCLRTWSSVTWCSDQHHSAVAASAKQCSTVPLTTELHCSALAVIAEWCWSERCATEHCSSWFSQ